MIDTVLYKREYHDNLSVPGPVSIRTRSFPRPESVRLHCHPSLEVNYFEQVEGTVWMNNQEYTLDSVRGLILPPWSVHRYEIRKNRGQATVVQLSLTGLTDWLQDEHVRSFLSDRASAPATFSGDELPPPPIPGGDLFSVIAYLFVILGILSAHRSNTAVCSPESWLLRVLRFSEANLDRKILLDEAAAVAGKSRSGFTKAFREQAGESYHTFLSRIRLEHARECINHGDTVTMAALSSGFSDASHLIRHYREKYGSTPRRDRSL